MITTSAVSSRIDSAISKAMNIRRQRRCIANHQAYSIGAITNASGWKLAQLIHWIGAYIRYTTAKTRPIHGLEKRSRAIR